MKKLSVILLLGITLVSCTKTELIYESINVYQIPFTKEALPKLTQEQQDSMRQDVFDILVERDELLLLHIALQNKIIIMHNSKR